MFGGKGRDRLIGGSGGDELLGNSWAHTITGNEPEFDAIVAHRGRLLVVGTTAGSEGDAAEVVSTAIAEAVFERANQISGPG